MKQKIISSAIILVIGMILAGLVVGNPSMITSNKQVHSIVTDQNEIENVLGSSYSEDGTYNNYTEPSSTETEVVNFVLNDEEVQAWVTDHPNYQYTTFYDGFGQWFVEFIENGDDYDSTPEINPMMNTTSLIHVLDVYVLDEPLQIVQYEEYTITQPIPSETPIHIEDEALSVANNLQIVQDFTTTYSYTVNTYYSYGYWEVNYYSEDYQYYVIVSIDDLSLSVLTVYGNIKTNALTLSPRQAINIALDNENISYFLDGKNYTIDTMFVWYPINENNPTSNAFWYVSFWNDTLFDSSDSAQDTYMINYEYYYDAILAFAVIDDASQEILYYMVSLPPALTSTQAIAIAENNTEISAFLESINADYVYAYATYSYYDGQWTVFFQSTVMLDAYAYAVIDDATQQITWVYVSYPDPMPTLTIDEVLQLVNSTDEYQALKQYGPLEMDVQYIDGEWYVYYYGQTFLEAYMEAVVDDATGNVSILYFSEPTSLPSLSTSEVIAIANTSSGLQEFLSNNPDAEMDIYYYNGTWVVIYMDTTGNGYYVVIDDATATIIDEAPFAYYFES